MLQMKPCNVYWITTSKGLHFNPDIYSVDNTTKKEQNINKDAENKPYFANAQVGDKVFCLMYGEGTIETTYSKTTPYPIKVKFNKNATGTYSIEGKTLSSANQILFYESTVITIYPGQEPIREYIPQVGDIVNLPKKEVGIVQNVFTHPVNGKTTLAVIVQSKHSFYKEKNQMDLTLSSQWEYLENASLIKRYNTVKEAFNSKEFDYNQ